MEGILTLSTNIILIGILWKLYDIHKILKEVKRKDFEKENCTKMYSDGYSEGYNDGKYDATFGE